MAALIRLTIGFQGIQKSKMDLLVVFFLVDFVIKIEIFILFLNFYYKRYPLPVLCFYLPGNRDNPTLFLSCLFLNFVILFPFDCRSNAHSIYKGW